MRKNLEVQMEHLEEGQLLRDADAELMRAASHLAEHLSTYGARADGAKATVRIDVELKAVNAGEDNECINIITNVRSTTPSRPKVARIAFAEANPDGLPYRVFMRPGLTSLDHPDQGTLGFENTNKDQTPAETGAQE